MQTDNEAASRELGKGQNGSGNGNKEIDKKEDNQSFDEWYDEVAINCFRFLGCKTLEDVDKITMREYLLRMKACRLRMVDDEMKLHKQAFLNLAVKATKKVGKNKEKPLYKHFSDFYDYEKEIKHVLRDIDGRQEKSTFSELSKHLKRQEKEKGGK